MSFSFTIEEWIDAPPERVYQVSTDLDRADAWMNGLVRIEWLTHEGFREGARWREVRKMFGKEAAEEFEVRQCDPPRAFTLWVDGSKGSTGKGEYLFEHRLVPERGGTVFTMDARVGGMGLLGRLLAPIMKGGFRKAIRKDVLAMKAFIEGQGD